MQFVELAKTMFQLYENKKYAEALTLLNQEAVNFPESAYHTYYWRMCLTSILDDTSETLRLFREAVDLGLWFPVEMLRNDSDLAKLQGQTEFEQLIEICRIRKKDAQEKAKPEFLFLPVDAATSSLLIALHGNLSNPKQSVSYWKSAHKLGWSILLPQSSQVGGPNLYVWNDLEKAVNEVSDHYVQACEEHRVNETNTIIGGFSKGAGTAIWISLGDFIKTRGFIAVAPSFHDIDRIKGLIQEKQTADKRGYIVVGKKDKKSLESSIYLSELMHANGLVCHIEIHDQLGHEFPSDFETSLTKALEFIQS